MIKAIYFAGGGVLMLILQIASLVFLRKKKRTWTHPALTMSPIILMAFHPVVPGAVYEIFMKGYGHKALMTAMQWSMLWGATYFWNKNKKAALCNLAALPLTLIDLLLHIFFGAIK